MKGLVSLFAVTIAALPAQTPFDGAPVAFELRTTDASFAAMVQKALRTVERDPRAEGQDVSIRVRLRHAADIGQRVSETSVGPPLAAGAFAEIEIDPKVVLAAYAPDVAALRKEWTPRLEVSLVASGWSKGTGAKVVAGLVDGLAQVARVRATITGDPRQPTSSLRIVADVVAREGSELRGGLAKLRPASRVCGDAVREGEVAVTLNLGSEGLDDLIEPLLALVAPAVAAEPDLALTRKFVEAWSGAIFMRVTTDMRTSYALAFGARDASAMWKLLTDPALQARNVEARARERRDVEYHVGAQTHRDVPIMQVDSTPAGAKTTSQFAAVAGDAVWCVFGPAALDSLRTAIDRAVEKKPLLLEMAEGELLRIDGKLANEPKAITVRGSVLRRDTGIAIDVAVER